MLRRLFWIIFGLGTLFAIVASVFVVWGYYYMTRDLPDMQTVEDYRPSAVSQVYASDGTLIAEFFEERRYPTKLAEIPKVVVQSFLAAEDVGFYSHPGIDPVSIARAFVKNIRTGSASQGGSTITQQVVKNLLLTPERTVERKVKEALLSHRLEERLSKDEILEIYLNQIYFGNAAYGIKAASRLYFHKELSELTIAEGSLLAGLPKAPSRYSPIANPKRAKRRQRYVLDQMVRAGFVTADEADKAYAKDLKVFKSTQDNIYHVPYYVSEVRKLLADGFKELRPDVDGLKIYTGADINASTLARWSLRKGLRVVERRRGWRGVLDHLGENSEAKFQEKYGKALPVGFLEVGQLYPAYVSKINKTQRKLEISLGSDLKTSIPVPEWAKKQQGNDDNVSWRDPFSILAAGDVIQVLLKEQEPTVPFQTVVSLEDGLTRLELGQDPKLEGAVVLLDPYSGIVKAIVGGYSYQRSQFNRATQSHRQPGSAFKPIVYLTAIDGFGYTPATIVYDSPRVFRMGDQVWQPENFDEKFLGPITLRVALERSRNLVSADIVSNIGVDAVIKYAHKLGIESKIGRNLSISLGSSEVTLLELARAYGVFAAKGALTPSRLITRIEDRNGKVLYDYQSELEENHKQAISESSAFVMANMMKGVVQSGTGQRVKVIGRPVAGKTGTSNDQMDAWFMGYTPEYVCGVWVGFDVKKKIGSKETGGVVSAPIWLDLMKPYLNHLDEEKFENLKDESKAISEATGEKYIEPEFPKPADFEVPEGVDGYLIDKFTGLKTDSSNENAIYEYFIKGTGPDSRAAEEEETEYLGRTDI